MIRFVKSNIVPLVLVVVFMSLTWMGVSLHLGCQTLQTAATQPSNPVAINDAFRGDLNRVHLVLLALPDGPRKDQLLAEWSKVANADDLVTLVATLIASDVTVDPEPIVTPPVKAAARARKVKPQ